MQTIEEPEPEPHYPSQVLLLPVASALRLTKLYVLAAHSLPYPEPNSLTHSPHPTPPATHHDDESITRQKYFPHNHPMALSQNLVTGYSFLVTCCLSNPKTQNPNPNTRDSQYEPTFFHVSLSYSILSPAAHLPYRPTPLTHLYHRHSLLLPISFFVLCPLLYCVRLLSVVVVLSFHFATISIPFHSIRCFFFKRGW